MSAVASMLSRIVMVDEVVDLRARGRDERLVEPLDDVMHDLACSCSDPADGLASPKSFIRHEQLTGFSVLAAASEKRRIAFLRNQAEFHPPLTSRPVRRIC
jgi:hypothetical protein